MAFDQRTSALRLSFSGKHDSDRRGDDGSQDTVPLLDVGRDPLSAWFVLPPREDDVDEGERALNRAPVEAILERNYAPRNAD